MFNQREVFRRSGNGFLSFDVFINNSNQAHKWYVYQIQVWHKLGETEFNILNDSTQNEYDKLNLELTLWRPNLSGLYIRLIFNIPNLRWGTYSLMAPLNIFLLTARSTWAKNVLTEFWFSSWSIEFRTGWKMMPRSSVSVIVLSVRSRKTESGAKSSDQVVTCRKPCHLRKY